MTATAFIGVSSVTETDIDRLTLAFVHVVDKFKGR